MDITEKEFQSLSGMISDRDVKISAKEMQIEQLTRELQEVTEERDFWQNKYIELSGNHAQMELENTFLRQYLLLSWEKIQKFINRIHDISLLSFLHTFMNKTAKDERALATINKYIELPEEGTVMQTTNNFNAPIGQQINHTDNITLTTKEDKHNGEERTPEHTNNE